MSTSLPKQPDENVEEYIERIKREQPELAAACERIAYHVVYGDAAGDRKYLQSRAGASDA